MSIENIHIDNFLLLIKQLDFFEYNKICSASRKLNQICKENQNYINRFFLKRLYPLKMIDLFVDINANEKENINLHKLTMLVHKYFNNKTLEEILHDETVYISKNYDVFIVYKQYIIPLPMKYYNEKMDIRLYINNNYEIFNNNDIKYISKQLWTNPEFKKTQVFDLIEINRREVKYIRLNEEIPMLIDVIDNFAKSSDYYKKMVSRINNLKRFKVLYNNILFDLSETYVEFKGVLEFLPEKLKVQSKKSKSTKKRNKNKSF